MYRAAAWLGKGSFAVPRRAVVGTQSPLSMANAPKSAIAASRKATKTPSHKLLHAVSRVQPESREPKSRKSLITVPTRRPAICGFGCCLSGPFLMCRCLATFLCVVCRRCVTRCWPLPFIALLIEYYWTFSTLFPIGCGTVLLTDCAKVFAYWVCCGSAGAKIVVCPLGRKYAVITCGLS